MQQDSDLMTLHALRQDLCGVVLAGAGCAFGLLPLFLADVALNFGAIRCALRALLALLRLLAPDAWDSE
jgi:hypothetical protein